MKAVLSYSAPPFIWAVQERVKDVCTLLRNAEQKMEQLGLRVNANEFQLQASQKKIDHYERILDTITSQLHDLLQYQSSMIGHYEEEKRRTTHILETIMHGRSPFNGGKHVKRRTVSDEGTRNRRPSPPMGQWLGSYNSAPTLKEATAEPQEESDFLLQQGLAHQHEMNGRVVSAHDTGQTIPRDYK